MMKVIDLLELSETVERCRKCTLCQFRTYPVFGTGSPNAKVMFVGEAPNIDDDKEGLPFIGKTNALLTAMIVKCGLTRESVYITNVIKCRPPLNRLPDLNEVHSCLSHLEKQISIVNPQFIVCLGSVASTALIGMDVDNARGFWHFYMDKRVLCTYHPAQLMKNESAKELVSNDLQLLITELRCTTTNS
jgi:DNA polymerase